MVNRDQVLAKIKQEGDFHAWDVTKNGRSYHCVVVRHTGTGHLNGYVGINKDHPLFAKGKDLSDTLKCHGKVTCTRNGFRDEHLVLHEDPNWIVFGFDTNHYSDYVPFNNELHEMLNLMIRDEKRGTLVYRDLEYVQSELSKMIDQLETLCSSNDEEKIP